MRQTTTLQTIEYVLQNEAEDYMNWCEDNNLEPKNISDKENQKHIFAIACMAYENETGLRYET